MKSRQVKLLLLSIVFIMVSSSLIAHRPVYAMAHPTNLLFAAKPTEPVMTQPIPPPVEPGANMPIVCGGIVILIIIIGGIVWNLRLRKASQGDH